MYRLRKERWKSLRTVSLMKRFFFSTSPRDWGHTDTITRQELSMSHTYIQ